MSLIKSLNIWFWFVFMVSLTPLGISLGIFYAYGSNAPIYMAIKQIISHGELLLICIPLLGGSIGDLVKVNKLDKIFIQSIFGAILHVFIYTAGFFAVISSSALRGLPMDQDLVFYGSIITFGSTLLFVISAIVINKPKQNRLGTSL